MSNVRLLDSYSNNALLHMIASSTIEVLGVHRLNIEDEWFNENFLYAYGDGSGEEEAEYVRLRTYFRELLEGVALVELRVVNRDEAFAMAKFTQVPSQPSTVPEQGPYLERYLTSNGAERLPGTDCYFPDVPAGDLRLVFFMHFWNSQVPLQTPYGPISCPHPSPMPTRLAELTEYEPVD